jgi:GNAT superfamily N-acetyltransferase
MRPVQFRRYVDADFAAVMALRATTYAPVADVERYRVGWRTGHAVVGHTKAGELVAARVQHRITPDTLSDGLAIIAPGLRGLGLGRQLVEAFEAALPVGIALSVVMTSTAARRGEHGDAVGFWLQVGYAELMAAGTTTVLGKRLAQTDRPRYC